MNNQNMGGLLKVKEIETLVLNLFQENKISSGIGTFVLAKLFVSASLLSGVKPEQIRDLIDNLILAHSTMIAHAQGDLITEEINNILIQKELNRLKSESDADNK